jgi:hypothetical protein
MGEELPAVRFLLVENIPFHTTVPDLSSLFRHFGEVRRTHLFRFPGRYTTYDLNAGLLEFPDVVPPELVRQLKTARYGICGCALQVTPFEDIALFQASGLIVDIHPDEFRDKIEPSLTRFGCLNNNQFIQPQEEVLKAHLLRFRDERVLQEFIESNQGYRIYRLIGWNQKVFTLPDDILDKPPILKDFRLIHCGKSYDIFKSTAALFSEVIKNCEADFLAVPDVPGPFNMIVDFFNLHKIVVTPETVDFLKAVAAFLRINEILSAIGGNDRPSLTVRNVAEICEMPDRFEFKAPDLVRFIATNLMDLVQIKQLNKIPIDFISQAIELAAGEEEVHDTLIDVVMAVEGDSQVMAGLLRFLDPLKIGPHVLAGFFKDAAIDLNRIRDFVRRAVLRT